MNIRFKKVDKNIPSSWTSNEGYEEVRIDKDSSEWDIVYSEFISTLRIVPEIDRITRIENHMIWSHYALMKKNIANELSLWHGTSFESLPPICQKGFNRSYAGMHATAYGEGTYFARDSSYSLNYSSRAIDKWRYMIWTKVLVGQYALGKKGMKEPNEGGREFDSAVNSKNDPSIYVVFKDYQAYPAYVVKFNL